MTQPRKQTTKRTTPKPADGTVILDLADLTIAEIEAIEKETGKPFHELWGPHPQPSYELLRAVLWVTKRRADPDFTWEQAGAIRFGTVELAGPDPTIAASD